ncbi:MAG: hypothetical protein KJ645_01265, partial [Planctomycetes bacterium]|nr:hypothetical protein [Planctomycetota bacterium]
MKKSSFDGGQPFLVRTLLVLTFLVIALFGLFPVCNLDIGLHLKTGEYIVQNLSVPKTNLFSCANQDFRMVDDKWLFQVIAYLIHLAFGFHGLVIFRILLLLGCFTLMASVGFRKDRALSTLIPMAAALILCSRRLYMRPDLVSIFFLCLYAFLFMRTRRRDRDAPLYFVPLIHILWANIHGYFIVGLILIGIFWAWEWLVWILSGLRKSGDPEIRRKSCGRIKTYGIVLLLSIAASFINPNFHLGAYFPIQTLLELRGSHSILLDSITEFSTPWDYFPFKNNAILIYPWFIAFSAVVILFHFLVRVFTRKESENPCFANIEGPAFLMFLTLLLMSFSMERNIPQFALISIPMLSIALNGLSKFSNRSIPGFNRWMVPSCRCLFVVFLLVLSADLMSGRYYFRERSPKTFGSGISKRAYPEKALSFVRDNRISGNAFTSFDTGSYFVYGCFPENLPLIDGNTFGYSIDFFKKYKDVMVGEAPFSELTKPYGLRFFFLRFMISQEKVVIALLKDPQWKLVYFDGITCIFLEDISINRNLIAEHEIKIDQIKDQYIQDTIREKKPYSGFFEDLHDFVDDLGISQSSYPLVTLNWARFFALAGVSERALQYYGQAVEENMFFTEGYLGLSQVYTQLGDLNQGELNARKALECRPIGTAYYYLGCIFEKRGMLEDAKLNYEAASAITPEDVPILNNLAVLSYRMGDLEQAKILLERLIALGFKADHLDFFL